MFDIDIKDEKKLFLVVIGGNVTPVEGEDFIKILKNNLDRIPTKDYNLVVKINSIKVTSMKMILILSKIMDIYKNTDFKRIFSIVENKKVGEEFVKKFQRQIGREVILCEDFEDVYKKL